MILQLYYLCYTWRSVSVRIQINKENQFQDNSLWRLTAFYKQGFLLVPERQSRKGKWNNVLWSCGSVCHYTGELVLSQWKNLNQPYIVPWRNKRNLSKSNSSPFILSLQRDVIKDTCTIALERTLLEGPWEGGPAHPSPASTLLPRIAGVWIVHYRHRKVLAG